MYEYAFLSQLNSNQYRKMNPGNSTLKCVLALLVSCFCPGLTFLMAQSPPETVKPSIESQFISNARQLTFEGRRAGEGYFNADGTAMAFQSERVEGNPFFQIFLLDFETGDVDQLKSDVADIFRHVARLYQTSGDLPSAEAHLQRAGELDDS